MAKATTKKDASEDSLDDLLGPEAPAPKKVDNEEVARLKEELQKKKDEAKEAAKKLKAEQKEAAKALKAAEKGEKGERQLKGQKVTFTNQKGEVIEGYGQLYYVVRQGGKLHYKEASKVTVMEVPAATPAAEA